MVTHVKIVPPTPFLACFKLAALMRTVLFCFVGYRALCKRLTCLIKLVLDIRNQSCRRRSLSLFLSFLHCVLALWTDVLFSDDAKTVFTLPFLRTAEWYLERGKMARISNGCSRSSFRFLNLTIAIHLVYLCFEWSLGDVRVFGRQQIGCPWKRT